MKKITLRKKTKLRKSKRRSIQRGNGGLFSFWSPPPPPPPPPPPQVLGQCGMCYEDITEGQPLVWCYNAVGERGHHCFHEQCIFLWCRTWCPQNNQQICKCPMDTVNDLRFSPQMQAQIQAHIFAGMIWQGRGEPAGMRFNLLPPALDDGIRPDGLTGTSALTDTGYTRWPENYRPTEEELNKWDIVMPYSWWTEYTGNDRRLPVGWYEFDDNQRRRDPNYRHGVTTIFDEDFMRDDGNIPDWIYIAR